MRCQRSLGPCHSSCLPNASWTRFSPMSLSPASVACRMPAAIQHVALVAASATVSRLAILGLVIAGLSLVLHAGSRMLASWHAYAIRTALGAPLSHLLGLAAADLVRLGAVGCAIGAGV